MKKFARYLSDLARVTIVVDDKLQDSLVNLDLVEVPLSGALNLAARRVGGNATRTGDIYYVGQLSVEDVNVLVRRVTRLDAAEAAGAIRAIQSTNGTVSAYPDGLLIIADRVQVLERVDALLEEIERVGTLTWVIQLHVVALSYRDALDLGIDTSPVGRLAAVVSSGVDGSLGDVQIEAEAALESLLTASHVRESISVISEPVIFVRDGETSSFNREERYPYTDTIVSSDQGGVTRTQQTEFVDIGFSANVGAKQVTANHLSLDLDVTLSELVAIVDGKPLVRSADYNAGCVLATGGVYLVGSLERSADSDRAESLLGFGRDAETSNDLIQIWARVYAVE